MNFTKLFPLPIEASAHGDQIDLMIYLVHILMFVLLVGWGAFFIYVLFRFRRKKNVKADYHGLHSHASTAIEVWVVLAEAVLLLGFSIPFWAQQINAFPTRPNTMEIHVVAEQYAWNFHYPGPDGIFGNRDLKFYNKESNPLGLDPNDPDGKDDVVTINQLHLVIGRPVVLKLSSKDVIHSFAIPVMRVKHDVIPGMSIPLWFTPTKTGNFEIACAQLCGLGHYRMKGFLTVETQEKFDTWLNEQISANKSDSSGGDSFWN